MPNRKSITGSELFVVDNNNEEWQFPCPFCAVGWQADELHRQTGFSKVKGRT